MAALLVACLTSTAIGQVRPAPVQPCNPQRLVALLLDARPVEALAQSEICVADYRAEKSNYRTLEVYYHYVNAQLHALLGNFDLARQERENGDVGARFYGPGLFCDCGVSTATEGFLLEKRGDIAGARRAYLENPRSSYALGRLALLALQDKDDRAARLWARQGVLSGDATSSVVLGALEDLAGQRWLAIGHFITAKQVLAGTRNNFLPIHFAENWRIVQAMNNWGDSAKGPGAKVIVVNGRKQFYDAKGDLVGEERWPGILFSAEVQARQVEYNEWARTNHSLLPSEVLVEPQYPRNFASYQLRAEGAIQIRMPARIEPTGVLDISTVAIGFYKLASEWARLRRDSEIPLRDLDRAVPVASMDADTPGAFQAALQHQLAQTFVALESLYGYLRGVRMRTALGQVYDAAQEGTRYDRLLGELRRQPSGSQADGIASLPAALFDNPPDFVTAHIPPEQLSPEFIAELIARERAVRGSIYAARSLHELLRAAKGMDLDSRKD